MKRLILLTYNLKPGADEAAYADFMRDVDYPVFRQSDKVVDYRAFRVVTEAQAERGFQYFDLLEVDEFADLDEIFADPAISAHAVKWIERWSEHGPDAAPDQNFGIAMCEEIE